MPAIIRPAGPDDAGAIREIYAPIVANTVITFEIEPPSTDELRRRIEQTTVMFPWLVCDDGGVQGYAYASRHRERLAYQWSVDVSVYVDPHSQGLGVGRRLYTALFEQLVRQGFGNAYAGVVLPNAASVGLHESLGFQPVGVYRSVGYKLGAWHDVGWWHLPLQTLPLSPAAPASFEPRLYHQR